MHLQHLNHLTPRCTKESQSHTAYAGAGSRTLLWVGDEYTLHCLWFSGCTHVRSSTNTRSIFLSSQSINVLATYHHVLSIKKIIMPSTDWKDICLFHTVHAHMYTTAMRSLLLWVSYILKLPSVQKQTRLKVGVAKPQALFVVLIHRLHMQYTSDSNSLYAWSFPGATCIYGW